MSADESTALRGSRAVTVGGDALVMNAAGSPRSGKDLTPRPVGCIGCIHSVATGEYGADATYCKIGVEPDASGFCAFHELVPNPGGGP